MTWEIVAGLITLVGAVITIGKVIANNTRIMQKLSDSIDELRNDLAENKETTKENSNVISNHETRITVLEKKEQ